MLRYRPNFASLPGPNSDWRQCQWVDSGKSDAIGTWSSLRGNPNVSVMQTANNRNRHQLRCTHDVRRFVRDRRLAVQTLMRTSNVVVIVDKFVQ